MTEDGLQRITDSNGYTHHAKYIQCRIEENEDGNQTYIYEASDDGENWLTIYMQRIGEWKPSKKQIEARDKACSVIQATSYRVQDVATAAERADQALDDLQSIVMNRREIPSIEEIEEKVAQIWQTLLSGIRAEHSTP